MFFVVAGSVAWTRWAVVLCGSSKQNHLMAETHTRVGPELRGVAEPAQSAAGAMQRFNQRFIYGVSTFIKEKVQSADQTLFKGF